MMITSEAVSRAWEIEQTGDFSGALNVLHEFDLLDSIRKLAARKDFDSGFLCTGAVILAVACYMRLKYFHSLESLLVVLKEFRPFETPPKVYKREFQNVIIGDAERYFSGEFLSEQDAACLTRCVALAKYWTEV